MDSTQQRSLLITDIMTSLRDRYRGTGYRVLPHVQITLPSGEVRRADIVVDAGPWDPAATEPSKPIVSWKSVARRTGQVCRVRDTSVCCQIQMLRISTGLDSLLSREQNMNDEASSWH